MSKTTLSIYREYAHLLSAVACHIADADLYILSFMEAYLFPVSIFREEDYSDKGICIDSLNPAVIRLFLCHGKLFAVASHFRVAPIPNRETWERIKLFFNDYVARFPYRLGFLNVQVLFDSEREIIILRIGDSVIEFDDNENKLMHIPSDMPSVTAAMNGWLLGLAVVNGVGTLFAITQGKCERIRVASCVVLQSSRLVVHGDRLLALTGVNGDTLGEVKMISGDGTSTATGFGAKLKASRDVASLRNSEPTFVPMWTKKRELITGVVEVSSYSESELCFIKDDGRLVIHNLDSGEELVVGDIGAFERSNVLVVVCSQEIYVQYTKMPSHERILTKFVFSVKRDEIEGAS